MKLTDQNTYIYLHDILVTVEEMAKESIVKILKVKGKVALPEPFNVGETNKIQIVGLTYNHSSECVEVLTDENGGENSYLSVIIDGEELHYEWFYALDEMSLTPQNLVEIVRQIS